MNFKITHVGLEDDVVASLAALMVSVVADDGSIGFLHPLSLEASARYWRDALGDPGRMVFVAWRAGDVVGTVTLFLNTPQNQPHRAEIWKMMVVPTARRAGVAAALLHAAEEAARQRGRTLLNLDTLRGGPASHLYERLGWTRVGDIPDYALTPLGEIAATTIYFKTLSDPAGGA